MASTNLLFKTEYAINDKIKIVIPTVNDVLENEDDYYGLVSVLTSMPIDMMVFLDDIGIDFSEITEYDLFLIMFGSIRAQDTSLIFGALKLDNFQIAVDEQNGDTVLIDPVNDIKIDKSIQNQIASALRKIHHLEKNLRKPGNEEARKYMIERARVKIKRNRNKHTDSQLEQLIVAMVNAEQYKYDFESTRGLTIYQFNESVRQVIKKVDYDNKMYGVYTGSINPKDLRQEDLNWLSNK